MDFLLNVSTPMLHGLIITLQLFLVVIIFSIPLGLCSTLLANSKVKLLSIIANTYVFLLRGTPLLLQLFFIYYGLPFIPGIGKFLTIQDRFTAAAIAFVLNYGAYFAEIFRGALLSVDKGQYEAAKVLGFTRVNTMLRIIFPQMFRVALPSVCNECINLIKDSALVYAIGIQELLANTKSIVNSTANVTPYFLAAALYLLIITILSLLFRKLERRFSYE